MVFCPSPVCPSPVKRVPIFDLEARHRAALRTLFQKGRILAQNAVVGTSFTSTPRSTRRLLGLFSNYARRFPTTPLRDISSSTATSSLTLRSSSSSRQWTAPSIRVARGSLSQLGRSRYSAGRREVRPQHLPSRADHALKHGIEGAPGLESSPGLIMMMDRGSAALLGSLVEAASGRECHVASLTPRAFVGASFGSTMTNLGPLIGQAITLDLAAETL